MAFLLVLGSYSQGLGAVHTACMDRTGGVCEKGATRDQSRNITLRCPAGESSKLRQQELCEVVGLKRVPLPMPLNRMSIGQTQTECTWTVVVRAHLGCTCHPGLSSLGRLLGQWQAFSKSGFRKNCGRSWIGMVVLSSPLKTEI